MYIDSPTWYLKQTCPCCYDDGQLQLLICTNCNKIVAVCDLCKAIFIDAFAIDFSKMGKNPKECPTCGAVDKFRVAKDYEIIALGLTTNEYE